MADPPVIILFHLTMLLEDGQDAAIHILKLPDNMLYVMFVTQPRNWLNSAW